MVALEFSAILGLRSRMDFRFAWATAVAVIDGQAGEP
jgi:hypothetical protein